MYCVQGEKDWKIQKLNLGTVKYIAILGPLCVDQQNELLISE